MSTIRTPRGITPPAPGLEREEPTFVAEEDIPTGDTRPAARSERSGPREGQSGTKSERE